MVNTVGEQASKGGSVEGRDGGEGKSLQKSERSTEEGEVEEAFEFLAEEEKGDDGEEGQGGDPVTTGNVDDDDRQPIPEGKVIGSSYNGTAGHIFSTQPIQFSPFVAWSHFQIFPCFGFLDHYRGNIGIRT